MLLLAMAVLIVAIGLVNADAAAAHTPSPDICVRTYASAPVGEKFAALVECQQAQAEHVLQHACQAPRPIVRAATVQGRHADAEQRRVLTTVMNEGRRRRASGKVIVSSVATTVVEAWARNLPYGDLDSLGSFQIRAMHGSPTQRMNVRWSADWYLDQAVPASRRHPRFSIGELAQHVQVSAHPDRYDRWAREAQRTYDAFLGACPR